MQKQGMFVAAGLVTGLVIGFLGKSLVHRRPTNLTSTTSGESPWAACYLQSSSDSSPLFELDGKAYSSADLSLDMQFRLSTMLGEEYRRQQGFLESAGLRLYIAKEKGIDTKGAVPDLTEILPDDMKVSDEEAKQFFETNKQSFPPKVSFETVKPSIMSHLRREKEQRMVTAYRQKLQAENKIKWNFMPQCPPPMSIDVKTFPKVGSGSKTNLSLVTGFFCRSCRETWAVIDETLSKNIDKLNWRPIFLVRPNSVTDSYLAKALYCTSKQSEAHLAAFVKAGHQIPIQYDSDLKGLVDHVNTKILSEIKIAPEDLGKCIESDDAVAYATRSANLVQNASLPNRPYFIINDRLLLTDSDNDVEIAKAFTTLIH